MPRSVLLGRVVAEGEPLWLPEDLEAVTAWQHYLDETCSGCGQPMAETLSPDLEGAYEAEVMQCHACAARETGAKDINQPGLKVAVALTERARADLNEKRNGVG